MIAVCVLHFTYVDFMSTYCSTYLTAIMEKNHSFLFYFLVTLLRFSIRNPNATFDWIVTPQEVKLGLLNCHSFIGPSSPISWKTKVNLQNHLSLIQPPPSPTKKLIIRIKLKTSPVVVFDSCVDRRIITAPIKVISRKRFPAHPCSKGPPKRMMGS